MKEIKLNMTVVEINTIIKALGQFPYNQVSDLINNIHQQASQQLNLETGEEKKTEVKHPSTTSN